MERQIPKNVRQIGNVSDSPKIYVEDYVDTFFNQLCEKCVKAGKGPMGAFLIGDIQSGDQEDYVYIYGAVQMHELKLSGTDYVIDDNTWKRAYEDCKQFFDDGEMLGWFVAHPGGPLKPDAAAVKLHRKSFPKKNTVLIMRDPAEKDETYFVHKMNDLMEIGGRYTYYEKNPCMQNYMISSRKKNGVLPSETVEDRAAQDFRDLVRKRGRNRRAKKSGSLIYAAAACMALVLVIMGVSMFNSADRMRSVQTTLETLADAGQGSEAAESVDEPSAEAKTQAASAPVTAVTPEDMQTGETDPAGDAQADTGNIADNVQPDAGNAADDGQDAAGNIADDAQPAEETASGMNGSNGIYIVEKGDTLAIISKKMYGDVNHVDAICRMNGISDGNLIYIGQKLLLP
ncbi:MAG TPA: LysM peptidoglycan-binding domain-containing protein [Candidatus Choladocola avistercoris]|nr:LysM peptidoglycan-binding domain-containing protein [Candidatus Choladocola avistercoris]